MTKAPIPTRDKSVTHKKFRNTIIPFPRRLKMEDEIRIIRTSHKLAGHRLIGDSLGGRDHG